MSQRITVRLLVLGAAGAVAAFSSPAAFAAPAPAHSAPAQVSAAVATQESHGLHALTSLKNTTVSSTNWSGYAATGGTGAFKSVSASWKQPAVTCSSKSTYSSFWVGLDGYSNSALEQTGTEADCIGGRAEYGAWWEVLPASESPYSVTVAPGDSLTASVTDNGNGTFTMTLKDSTQGWTKTTTHSGSSGYKDSSAEVIAEATEVGGSIAKLSNFGTVTFTGATAGGTALGSLSPTEIVMAGNSDTKAQPGSISGGTFSDVWKAAS
ncbi:MAG TPA: G1 family glutamic endopeptidase [Actinocrinis sp.]|nr:G1 family glutamic endopeptidase [Actinocrinis sp.]